MLSACRVEGVGALGGGRVVLGVAGGEEAASLDTGAAVEVVHTLLPEPLVASRYLEMSCTNTVMLVVVLKQY